MEDSEESVGLGCRGAGDSSAGTGEAANCSLMKLRAGGEEGSILRRRCECHICPPPALGLNVAALDELEPTAEGVGDTMRDTVPYPLLLV